MKSHHSERGSLLLGSAIITLLLLAAVIQFCRIVQMTTTRNIGQLAKQKAMMNADSGIQGALQYLRSPEAASLEAGTPTLLSSTQPGTTFYLSLLRQETDNSLVDVYATGYYHIANGSVIAPDGSRSEMAAIYTQVQLRNVGSYFAASPAKLEITYGSDISAGAIYARNLVFQQGSGNPRTRVKAASYFNSVEPGNYLTFVDFIDPGQPVRLDNEPVLPTLDAGLRSRYELMAGPEVLPTNAVLTGALNTPAGNAYKVIFAPGNVTLGTPGNPATVDGTFLIYSRGDIYIGNDFRRALAGSSWAALLAEGNIFIPGGGGGAPDNLTIEATLVTNGEVRALGPSRSNGRLTMTGGIITGKGVFLGDIYAKSRTYTFQAPDPNLPLPFATQVILYRVTAGKYR